MRSQFSRWNFFKEYRQRGRSSATNSFFSFVIFVLSFESVAASRAEKAERQRLLIPSP
jgi:hypothetical protein